MLTDSAQFLTGQGTHDHARTQLLYLTILKQVGIRAFNHCTLRLSLRTFTPLTQVLHSLS
jgi:hypothetical protein